MVQSSAVSPTAIAHTEAPSVLLGPVVANDPSVSNPESKVKSDGGPCQAVVCNFEEGYTIHHRVDILADTSNLCSGTACAYQQKIAGASNFNQAKAWELSPAPYKNPATGIRKIGIKDCYLLFNLYNIGFCIFRTRKRLFGSLFKTSRCSNN